MGERPGRQSDRSTCAPGPGWRNAQLQSVAAEKTCPVLNHAPGDPHAPGTVRALGTQSEQDRYGFRVSVSLQHSWQTVRLTVLII